MLPPIMFICSGLIDIIGFPYDCGANVKGSGLAPFTLRAAGLERMLSINTNRDYKDLMSVFTGCSESLYCENIPLVLGGDHSVAIASIAAAISYSKRRNLNIGVLWCDAHADFNTDITSPSGNLHGMPLAILFHHTHPHLQYTHKLDETRVLQFGVREMDYEEASRIMASKIEQTNMVSRVEEWAKEFDVIHMSFDVDVLDPFVAPGVSTPVNDGILLDDAMRIMDLVRSKLLSVDFVELNPLNDESGKTVKLSLQLLKNLLH